MISWFFRWKKLLGSALSSTRDSQDYRRISTIIYLACFKGLTITLLTFEGKMAAIPNEKRIIFNTPVNIKEESDGTRKISLHLSRHHVLFQNISWSRSGETTMRSDNPRPSLSALGHPHLPLDNGGTADNYSERAIDVPPAFASAAGGARPKTTAGEIYANA